VKKEETDQNRELHRGTRIPGAEAVREKLKEIPKERRQRPVGSNLEKVLLGGGRGPMVECYYSTFHVVKGGGKN